MFGNLVHVSTPNMVERYNRSLERLSGRRTGLSDFHIDIAGYSPEIGEEFDDPDYLNPHGCNRQFILLDLEQAKAPLIGAHFSTSRRILRRFYEDNRKALFTLTARDAVLGEALNSVFRVQSIADLLDIRTIRIEANTSEGLLTDATELRERIARFEASDEAWSDDETIEEMIALAARVGDVRRSPVDLEHVEYSHDNTFTRHFGGLYIFREVPHPGILACDPACPVGDINGIPCLPLQDHAAVAHFLERNALTETIWSATGLDEQALLRQRLDFILIDYLAGHPADIDLSTLSRADLRRATYRHADDLPPEFHALTRLLRELEGDQKLRSLPPQDPAYFYQLRARTHPDRDLVNHLLARMAPLDVRQLFICNKDEFYTHYRQWSEAKRDYVARFLAEEYAIDKQGVRRQLFGPEPSMAEEEEGAVGIETSPWGARQNSGPTPSRSNRRDPWSEARKPEASWASPAGSIGPWGERTKGST